MMQRHFFSGAAEVTPDKQGRVMVPAALAKHARLERDVVVAGVHDHLEIWDRAAWRAQVADVEGRAEDVAERLASQRD
jgi:MraZ protein